jgi:hypothetical protein
MAYIGNSPENIQRGRRAIYEFTSTAGQTVYTGLDDNNQTLDLLEANEQSVFLNGIRLVPTDDYTVSGDTLTLTSAASLNDHMIIETQTEVGNAVTYTRAESDARYINYNGDIVSGDLQISGEVDAGSLIVDTDVLVVDATNNRVGVGTASPVKELTIKNSTGDPSLAFLGRSTDGHSAIRFYDNTGSTLQGTLLHYTGGFYINPNAGGTAESVASFLDSGNVGIGTSSPTTKLQSKGGSIATLTDNAGLIANASASFVVDHGNDYGLYTGYIAAASDAIGIAATRTLGGALPLSLQPFGGNVGIGTTATTAGQVTIQGSGTPRQLVITDDGTEKLQLFQVGNDATIEAASGGSNSTNLIFKTASSGSESEAMRIDSGGNLGLQITPNSWFSNRAAFQLGGSVGAISANNGLEFGLNFYVDAGTAISRYTQNGYAFKLHSDAGNDGVIFSTAGNNTSGAGATISWSEAMRITSSGHLLVGTTDDQPPTNSDVSGIALRSDGKIAASRSNGIAGDFNNNSEGNIVWFRKNGTVVATVSTRTGGGDAPYFGGYTNADTGIAFSSARMYPVTSSGVIANGTRDLGNTDARWGNLWLSGGVHLGGTGSANKLDDYEEGTWTPTLLGASSNPTVGYVLQTGHYTKIGNTVNLYCRLQTNSRSGGSGTALIGGLPFAHNSARAGGGVGYISGVNLSSGFAQFGLSGDAVTSTIRYCQSGDNVSATVINVTEVNSTHDIVFTYTYQTNS